MLRHRRAKIKRDFAMRPPRSLPKRYRLVLRFPGRRAACTQDIGVLKRQTKARLTQLDRQIAELDADS